MTTPKKIQHPVTKEKKTVKEWAAYYQVPRSSIGTWFLRLPLRKVFADLDNNRRPTKRGYKPSLFVDPDTEEMMTMFEWAQKLGYHEDYLRIKIKKGEFILITEKVWEDKRSAELIEASMPDVRVEIAKNNGALFLAHPTSGVSLPPFEWAEFYRVSIHEFYQAMKRFGRNSLELHEFFSKRNKAVGNG